jgi:ATP-dependent DNA helicase RecQ
LPTPHQILKQYWGYDNFRPQQEEIVNALLQGCDVLALLPTGGGKSLCYQLPAVMMDGFALVVSPLIALMQDQVEQLEKRAIRAACIHAGMHYNEVKRVLENMIHGPYKLLYVSPERLQSELFREYLSAFEISFVAVDEAHCISQWGHDFRPDYLKIAGLRNGNNDVPMIALTATATPEVQKDIANQLRLEKPALFSSGFERSNIFYDVRRSDNKNGDVLDHLQRTPGTSIIYCRSRKQTEILARYLTQQGERAMHYHAGMSKERRQEAQHNWMYDKVRIIVATTAFGMGIDKPDVRSVIHYDVPEHLEGYYQESGRAGRDGKPSVSLLLFNKQNITNLEQSLDIRFPPVDYLRKIYQAVAEYLQVPIGGQPDRYFDFDIADFCRKFGLEATAASYALKLLEQESLWTISDAVFTPATVQFTTTRGELENVMRAHPELAMAITALMRLYGSVFYYPTPIRVAVVARQMKTTQDHADAMIARLHHMDVLEYNKPKDGPQLFFHHYRVDSRHLIIDTNRINSLKRQHQARLKAMIAYLETDKVCRNTQLLAYFGEETQAPCGHCDVCAENGSPRTSPDVLRSRILDALGEHGMGLQQLSAYFPQAIKKDIGSLIRAMIDEGQLKLHENGMLSLIK